METSVQHSLAPLTPPGLDCERAANQSASLPGAVKPSVGLVGGWVVGQGGSWGRRGLGGGSGRRGWVAVRAAGVGWGRCCRREWGGGEVGYALFTLTYTRPQRPLERHHAREERDAHAPGDTPREL